MARKNYSEEFRRQAVDLYESTPGATLKGIAADLGVVRGTLKHWVDQYGTGKKTAPDGTTTTGLRAPSGADPRCTSLLFVPPAPLAGGRIDLGDQMRRHSGDEFVISVHQIVLIVSQSQQ